MACMYCQYCRKNLKDNDVLEWAALISDGEKGHPCPHCERYIATEDILEGAKAIREKREGKKRRGR